MKLSASPPAIPSHVHRLVQDENAKTILLNVPLEISVESQSRTKKNSTSSPKESGLSQLPRSKQSTPNKKRIRSASVGRDKKSDLQARYWAFLFENLRRAVDDLYVTCESDENVLASKEVILALENYARDFKNLVGWFKLKHEYESTPPLQRPTSLTWEVRKTSPAGKLTPTTALATQRLLMASPAKRVLTFEGEAKKEPLQTHEEVVKEVDVTPVDEKENEDPKNAEMMNIDKLKLTKNETMKSESKSVASSEALLSSTEVKANLPKPSENKVSSSKSTEVKLNSSKPSEGKTHTSRTSEVKLSSSKSAEAVKSQSRIGPAPKSSTQSRLKPSLMANGKVETTRPSSGSRISSVNSQVKVSGSPKVPRRNNSSESQHPKVSTKPRVSLVARQSAISTQSKPALARSATTSSIARTRKLVQASATRPSTTPLKGQPSSSKQVIQSTRSVPPFGSTSSMNSSCSTRSWADTVKGVETLHRSVEDLNLNQGISSQDDEGWETVRPRTRSRISPLNNRAQKGSTRRSGEAGTKHAIVKKDSLDSSLKVKHSAKSRYQVPSSAVSLPSLSFKREEAKTDHEVKGVVDKTKGKNFSSLAKNRPESRNSTSKLGNVTEGSSDTSQSDSQSECKTKSKKVLPFQTVNSKKKPASYEKNRPSVSKGPAKSEHKAKQSPELATETTSEDDGYDSAIAKNEVALKKAEEEEKKLAQEIWDTEKEELSDFDQGSTGGEESEKSSTTTDKDHSKLNEVRVESMSWVDQIELDEQMIEGRYQVPGRVIQLHEKLSSPARKKEPHETFKKHQEKQKQAKIRREKFQEEKTIKLNELNARIEEVRDQKNLLISKNRELHSHKMRKAEEKRHQYLESIKRKAHEEDAKQKEIAFINELQAQYSRIDMIAHTQTEDEKCEERLAEIAKVRDRKVEEREAKEARAEENRRKMEEDRKRARQALQERIRSRDERILEEQEQARKDREEAAREKARDREVKLSSVRAAVKDMKTELREKIQQKQEDAAKRHQEKLEKIRTKAFELSVSRCSTDEGGVPHLHAYETRKKCDLCNVLITNEVHLQSHLRGEKHKTKMSEMNNGKKLSGEEIQSCNIKHIVDAKADELDQKTIQIQERSKAMKRKVKKIKNKMVQKAGEYEANLVLPSKFDSPNRGKIGKSIKDINKLFSVQSSRGAWANKNSITLLERALGEISRALEKNNPSDQVTFFALDGFGVLFKIFLLLQEQKSTCVIPLKTIQTCCKTWTAACRNHPNNIEHVIKSNYLMIMVEILSERLDIVLPKDDKDLDVPIDGPQMDPGAKGLMELLTACFEDLAKILHEKAKPIDQSTPNDLITRSQDLISFMISKGTIDTLATYLNSIQDPIENDTKVGEFILSCLNFMSSMTKVSAVLVKSPVNPRKTPPNDPTNILLAFRVTDLAGIVSMLYGILLHQGSPSRGNEIPPAIPDHSIQVAKAGAQLLSLLMKQDLIMVQEVLGQEGISLEFRHIASYLVWYCQYHKHQEKLLHLVIVLVGYFSAKNHDNQAIIQSGHQPSVLQQLCSLPFSYFSQPELKKILFPTLIAVCHENKENKNILQDEMSYQLLEDFMKSPEGDSDYLVQLVAN